MQQSLERMRVGDKKQGIYNRGIALIQNLISLFNTVLRAAGYIAGGAGAPKTVEEGGRALCPPAQRGNDI